MQTSAASPRRSKARALAACTALLTIAMSAACSSDNGTPSGNNKVAGAVRLTLDNSAGTAVSLAPKSATLIYGHGILLKANIVDASGAKIPGAKPAWRSTNTAVATATALPDSGLAIDNGRAAISSISAGTAMIIASFEGVADTATITVTARPDSTGGGGTGTQRPATFEVIARVRGLVTPGDSFTRVTENLAGATVVLTRLPLQAGDSMPESFPRTAAPTVVGTLTADSYGVVRFPATQVSRYRLTITPPAGANWAGTTVESGPPWSQYAYHDILLRRP